MMKNKTITKNSDKRKKSSEPNRHYLKTINPYFLQVWNREKTFEFRKNDRNFKINDIVYLQEYFPLIKYFSGSEIKVKIISILQDFEGIEKGYCVFSFTILDRVVMNPELEGEVSPA